jgi:hypothetical protein
LGDARSPRHAQCWGSEQKQLQDALHGEQPS